MPDGSPRSFEQTLSSSRVAPTPSPTPTPNVKREFYNTSFLPSIGNVDGGWWDPAYYMFYLTVLLILINAIYINIKTKGKHIGLTLFLTILFFIKTYFFTRGASCLWAGGCQVFAVFHLIFPFIFIIIVFLMEDIALRLVDMDVDYSSMEAEKGSSVEEPAEEPAEEEAEEAEETAEEEEEESDGFSNMIEPFSSYYPY